MLLGLAVLALLRPPSGHAEASPTLRLPESVSPLRQSIELTLDPNLETYSGTIEVEVEIRRPTNVLWLNATGLKVAEASLGQADSLRPARVVASGDDFVGFSPASPLPAGPARLRASFEGTVSRRENEGIFAMQEENAWYLFTQFEPIAARKAFPCFDEPSYKIPWEITLRVPSGMVALSNAPGVSTTAEGGRDVIRFAPTRPLPSYLVAFVVGPFDFVEVGPSGRNRTPTRLVVPRGRSADTTWARETTPPILALLEDYFDRPYPYEKLDQVAIPGVGFAMEHPGLVTYGQWLMVQRPSEETIASRRAWASVSAHELAHQWFGDLVTMAWWDDTWLNESFASWLGEKVTDRLRPDWGVSVDKAAMRSSALEQDSLSSARRIRQPIASKSDILNAFDGITYGKGKAVLEMVEAWLGEAAFRRGVQAYMDRYAWSNATAADFASALASAAGRDVGAVLNTFLDQAGAPVISAEMRCETQPLLVLAQRPYRALGSPFDAKTWNVPVCARVAQRSTPACTELSGMTGEIRLGEGVCPDWFFANASAGGYYRAAHSAKDARRLLEGAHLTAAERVAVAGDLAALVVSGDVNAGDALGLVPLLARDPDRHVVDASTRLVSDLEPLVPDALVPHFQAFVRDAYGSRARELGWSARPGENEDVRLLRKSVVAVTARHGRDREFEKAGVALAQRWLDDPSTADPDLVPTILAAAAGAADRSLFDRMRGELFRTGDRDQRERLLGGLGAVREPGLAGEAVAITLDERVDVRESVELLWTLASRRETRQVAVDYLKSHYDLLAARLPGGGAFTPVMYFPWIGVGLCGDSTRDEMEAFFRERSAKVTGGPRELDKALEDVDQCVARKKAQQPSVIAFLDSLPAN